MLQNFNAELVIYDHCTITSNLKLATFLTLAVLAVILSSVTGPAEAGRDTQVGSAHLVLLLGAGGVVADDAGVDADGRRHRDSARLAGGRRQRQRRLLPGWRPRLPVVAQVGWRWAIENRLRAVVLGLKYRMTR